MIRKPKDLNSFIPEGWQGKYPPCQIQVNRDGELFSQGAPLIHQGVLELIFESVKLEDGLYLLHKDGKTCQLEVADTFFVVKRAEMNQKGVSLILNSGEKEALDPDSLWVGKNDILYCRVGRGSFPARFLRPAYYQVAQWIEPLGGGYALSLNGRLHPIAEKN